MGPILYLLYTNELPSISTMDCNHIEAKSHNNLLFGWDCEKCGITSSFADDSNYTMSEKSDEKLLERMNNILEKWVDFCNSNLLCINKRKQH